MLKNKRPFFDTSAVCYQQNQKIKIKKTFRADKTLIEKFQLRKEVLASYLSFNLPFKLLFKEKQVSFCNNI